MEKLYKTLNINSFVSFDVETTGLDARTDKIIEIGAVKYCDGKEPETFQQFVNPGFPIPPAISRLTGITDKDCQDQPGIDEVMPDFLQFIGILPLVAHNLFFDRKFIEAALKKDKLVNPCFDTLTLARMYLPYLKNHRLESVANHFGLKARFHRASHDARVTGEIFRQLLEKVRESAVDLKQTAFLLLEKTDMDAKGLFMPEGGLLPAQPPLKVAASAYEGYGAGTAKDLFRDIYEHELDTEEIRSVFVQNGLLADKMSGFEYRPEQVEMTRAVTKAFNQSGFALVEAGTGTGKSIAYLVPAIKWSLLNNCRVIISTNTKNLQEQLFFKDVPFLKKVLDDSFEVALLKGRSNYVCLNKWHLLMSEVDLKLTYRDRQNMLPLLVWLQETRTGDIAENNGFNLNQNRNLWSKLCCEANFCLGQRCRYFPRCFLMNARRKALQSHIVIINHSLLFADLVSDATILGHYEYLIMDEAHNLEKTAINYLGNEFNIWQLRSILHNLYEKDTGDLGLLVSLKNRFQNSPLAKREIKAAVNRLESAMDEVRTLTLQSQDFFSELTALSREWFGRQTPGRGGNDTKFRYLKEDGYLASIREPTGEMIDILKAMKNRLQDLYEWVRDLKTDTITDQDEMAEQLLSKLNDLHEMTGTLEFLIAAEGDQTVFWTQLPESDTTYDTRLVSAPLNVAEKLNDYLYDRMKTILFTSATMTVARDFNYIRERIGLNLVAPDRVSSLILGSSFDFTEQSLVLVPSFLPSPKDAGYQDATERFLAETLKATNKGSLVLFTSYTMLNRAYDHLKETLLDSNRLILGQGKDGSRTALINQFKENRNSILLGTDSFWEGVDVPGRALELLFIVRLPFTVPTEPIIQAQAELLEKQGINSFLHYTVPEAVIRFRQGFGRLIRTRNDKGVVVIMDSRVIRTRYGRLFLESLPTRWQEVKDTAGLIEKINAWE